MSAARKFHGRFSLDAIEARIGSLEWAIMKPSDSHVLRGPQGQRHLTTVGYGWNCGCEVRGTALTGMSTCLWSSCARHRAHVIDAPFERVANRLADGVYVPLDVLKDGIHLFERVPNTL